MSSTTKVKYKLDEKVVEALLQELEKSGVHRKVFDLNTLVNTKSHTFGDVASEKRRAVQKKFADVKRKGAISYLKYLSKYKVPPAEETQRAALNSKDEEESEEEDEEDKDDEEDKEDKEDEEAYSTDSSNELSISAKPTRQSSAKRASTAKKESTPEQRRAKKPRVPVPVPVADIQFTQTKKMNSDTEASTTEDSGFSSEYSSRSVQRRVEMLERPENKQDGTKEYPYIIIANPSKPETCQGFEVALVNEVKVENYVRSIYHIRHVTTQGMQDEWSAVIPREEFPALSNRAVLIQGPSQELWHQRPEIYHQDTFCERTKTVHETQQTAIKKSRERAFSYWLLVFPKGTMLENHVISNDSVNIKQGNREMEIGFEVENDNGDIEVETLYGLDVHWRIALAGGNMVSDPGSATKRRKKKTTKPAMML